MNTTIYLVRHSEPFKIHRGIEEVEEDILFANIKVPLSINGEKLAEIKSQNKEFENIDVVWSSDYVRTMSTAKYFAYRNNLKVNVSDFNTFKSENTAAIGTAKSEAIAAAKTETEAQVLALENGQVAKNATDIADLQALLTWGEF